MTVFLRLVSVFLAVNLWLVVNGQTLVESFRGDIRSCETACENSFAGDPDVELVQMLFGFCRRGCRFLNLIDVVNNFNNLNDTKEACFKSCRDSYMDTTNIDACLIGCQNQLPTAENRKKQIEDYYFSEKLSNLSPTLYINRIFSNMIEKPGDQTSRSYYSQMLNGGLVVISAKSSLVSDPEDTPLEDNPDNSYNYMEVRGFLLGPVDEMSPANGQDLSLSVAHPNRQTDSETEADSLWSSSVFAKPRPTRFILPFLFFMLVLLAVFWMLFNVPSVSSENHKVLMKDQMLKQIPFFVTADLPQTKILLSDDNGGYYPSQLKSSEQAAEVALPLPIKLKMETV